VKWPFGSSSSQKRSSEPATYPTYEFLKSSLEYPDSVPPAIDPSEIAPWTVTLMRIRLGKASDDCVAKAMRSAWDEVFRYGRERRVKSYAEARSGPMCAPSTVGPLLISTFSYGRKGANPSLGEISRDDVLIIWPQLTRDVEGEAVLCLQSAAIGARGPFELTTVYVAAGLAGGQLQGLWNKVSSNLRQFANCIPVSEGFFPDDYSFAEHAVQIPMEGEPLEVFTWLLSKHGTSTHEETVMHYKVTGNTASRFILESIGNMRSGEHKQFHSGSILIDLDNVAHYSAVRWTTDFGLQITFRTPVQFTATNFIPPSWSEERVKLMLYDVLIECDTLEDAIALESGFGRLLANRTPTNTSEQAPKSSIREASPTEPAGQSGNNFRVVEEAD